LTPTSGLPLASQDMRAYGEPMLTIFTDMTGVMRVA
jgi:hypothetical protein